jgi:hypothetical protein
MQKLALIFLMHELAPWLHSGYALSKVLNVMAGVKNAIILSLALAHVNI